MKKTRVYIMIMILIISSVSQVLLISKIAQATTDPYSINGNIYFESGDKAASTSTTWRLMGFIIRLDKSGYNSKAGGKTKYIEVRFDNENVTNSIKPNPEKPGYNITKYTISEEYFLSLMRDDKDRQKLYSEFRKKMSKDKLPDGTYKGGTIYINGIFGVYDSGKFKSGPYYTLSGISRAEKWGQETLNDFEQYFNIPLDYHPTKLEIDVPVSVEYHTSDNELMFSDDLGKVEIDEKKTYTFPDTYKFKGKEYELYRSYYVNMSKPTKMLGKLKIGVDGATLAQVKKRSVTATDLNGLKFIAMYKEKIILPPEDEIEPDSIFTPLDEPNPEAVIRADVRGNEQFDVEQGIPTTESVYVNATSEEYLYTYQFVKEVVNVPYKVSATKTYNLSWKSWEKIGVDKDTGDDIYDYVDKSEKSTKTTEVTVERKVAYWRISHLSVYTLDGVYVKNEALPDNNLYVKATDIDKPNVESKTSSNWQDHVLDPDGYKKNMTLDSENIVGGYIKPSIDSDDIKDCVEAIVGIPKVVNDKLVFNGATIMDDTETLKEGPKPAEIDESMMCNEDALYMDNLVIPRDKANMEYSSTGKAKYNITTAIGTAGHLPSNLAKLYDIEDINLVTVHTPTICNAQITDLKAYNQLVNPEMNRASLILDKSFTVRLSTTGEHNDYPGYGNRDYAKYIAYRQVKFPFDVYNGTKYVAAGTWITINSDETTFYLPTWVPEGNYEIQLEAPAINCDANNGYDKTEYLANYIIDDYVAIDSIFVNVSGRIYGLTMYDITDYPTWKDVFRSKDSLTLTGTNYTVGINDQNGLATGRLAKYTFPLVNGSHPTYETVGAVKLGYCTRFNFTTIGDLYKEDKVKIVPKFYYVDAKGQNRQEVDLYYTETFEGKRNYMVKVGSDKDKLNTKSYMLGDKYWQVPDIEIAATSYVTGKTIKDVKAQKDILFNFGEMSMSNSFRTYSGTSSYTPSKTIPSTVDPKTVIQSVQKWYGEYYLPSDVHVLPKGYDLNSFIRDNGAIDFNESIWLKNGYIIVNFEIVTFKEGKEDGHLSYINKDNALKGYCNMWKMEGSQLVKTDSSGNTFEFKYGDYLMYYTDKTAAQDYISGGTH